MAKEKIIPNIVIGRLPIYLRALIRMGKEGRIVASSQELGEMLGISAAQIRKDLSQFGEFGKQGTGYNIEFLANKLQEILKVDIPWDVAIVGAGDMGHALATYEGFDERGFNIKYIFDNDPKKIGMMFEDYQILDSADMASIISKNNIKIAMIVVPPNKAQEVAEALVEAGIIGIVNYAPINLNISSDINVQYVDPAIQLQRMAYYLK
jgi:redox-sensing transcriptional repressor